MTGWKLIHPSFYFTVFWFVEIHCSSKILFSFLCGGCGVDYSLAYCNMDLCT
jgi:hypothetical protein